MIGGGFALFGGYQLVTTRAFLQGATPVEAEVIANAPDCDDDGCTWWPRLAHTDASGARHEARTRHGSSEYGFAEGSRITALANPAYGYLRIPGAGNLYLLGGAFLVLGLLPVAIAIWLLLRFTFTRETAGKARA